MRTDYASDAGMFLVDTVVGLYTLIVMLRFLFGLVQLVISQPLDPDLSVPTVRELLLLPYRHANRLDKTPYIFGIHLPIKLV